jgi:hypothetical protein
LFRLKKFNVQTLKMIGFFLNYYIWKLFRF